MMNPNLISAIAKAKDGIKGRLDGHYQHAGVEWMLRQELGYSTANAKTTGGILADDMGLGKTMQSIATMRGNPMSTLIVTMVSTLGQWKDALIEFGNFKPIIVNPSFTGILPIDDDGDVVVITCYSSFQKNRGKTPDCLTMRKWGRIILDEGHIIRNEKTKVFKELSVIQAKSKWILSGTPIQNGPKDLWSLSKWIGVTDCSNLEELCDKYVLRRTQAEEGSKNPRLALPTLDTQVLYMNFKHDEERRLYSQVEEFFQERLDNNVKSSNNTAMEGIIRCQQICTHPKIYLDGCDKKKKLPKKKGCKRKLIIDEDDSEADFVPMSTSQFPGSNIYGESDTIFSSKVDFLCEDVNTHVINKKAKCLIFCSWTAEMKLIQDAFKKDNISSLIFDGKLSREGKENVLYNFKNTTIPILILQINCGSTGLNLQCASRVYIMSPHWNPCLELQAIGRAYRKGQVQKVSCVRLVMKDTIDERCLEIQNIKASMIVKTMMDESMQCKLGALKDVVLSDGDLKRIFKVRACLPIEAAPLSPVPTTLFDHSDSLPIPIIEDGVAENIVENIADDIKTDSLVPVPELNDPYDYPCDDLETLLNSIFKEGLPDNYNDDLDNFM